MTERLRRAPSRKSDEPVACTQCGARDAIQIEMTLPDGTEVNFCSCHRCENRWWDKEGKSLALDAVLQLARKPR